MKRLITPAGCLAATGDEEGKVRLWDLRTGQMLLTMIGFPALDREKVSQDWVAWTPDGF